MLFGIVYLTCFYMDWAPVRYYPDPRRFHLKITPRDGPAILWWVGHGGRGRQRGGGAGRPRHRAERRRPGQPCRAIIIPVLLLIYERRGFV
jgi:hypothetical protein